MYGERERYAPGEYWVSLCIYSFVLWFVEMGKRRALIALCGCSPQTARSRKAAVPIIDAIEDVPTRDMSC